MLCDMGAEVIKVEPPAGDLTRFQAPRRNGFSTYFVQQNTGKDCISVDLQRPEGSALVLDLAEHCDVLVENFRPGVMDRLGLSTQALWARRTDLIIASISGYGQSGVWRERRAYAPVLHAEAGLIMSQGDTRGGAYMNDRHSHADVYTALETTTAILAALFQRTRTGRGQTIDVSMADTMLYANEHAHDDLFDGDIDPDWIRSFGNEHHPIVTVADGTQAIVAANPAQKGSFEFMVASIERPELLDDPRFATPALRQQHLDALTGYIREFAATMPDVDALEAAFGAHGVAVGALRSVRDFADSDWAADRGSIAAVSDRGDGSFRIPEAPWRFSDGPDVGVRGEPRYRGEDNAEVLRRILGMDDAAISALAESGVLSDHLPR